jgi:TolB-like protein
MMSSMTPVGVVAGAVIVVNGFNTISREAAHNFLGDKQTEGIFADGSMEIAEFLGFSRQSLGTYKTVTLFRKSTVRMA